MASENESKHIAGTADIWGWQRTVADEALSGGTSLQDLANLMAVVGDVDQVARAFAALQKERKRGK